MGIVSLKITYNFLCLRKGVKHFNSISNIENGLLSDIYFNNLINDFSSVLKKQERKCSLTEYDNEFIKTLNLNVK